MTRQPTKLGWWLIDRMRQEGLSQTQLAERVGIAQASISRWTYDDRIRPDTAKLDRLADGLGLTKAERAELFAAAGHGQVAEIVEAGVAADEDWDEVLIEARMMLHPQSPLTDQARQELRLMLNAVVAPHREAMRRRRRAM